jgi:alpha-L-arabinofuranosidase
MERTSRAQRSILGLALSLVAVSSLAYGQKTTLTIQATRPGKPISPDLIYFTGTEVFRTANYYVQQLFGQNSGDTLLATTLDATARPVTLTASAVRDSKSGHIIVKIVNGASDPASLVVEFAGLAAGEVKATRTVLTGADADAFNEDGRLPAVKPVASEVTIKPAFECEAPANSLTVFRIHD